MPYKNSQKGWKSQECNNRVAFADISRYSAALEGVEKYIYFVLIMIITNVMGHFG